MVKRIFDFVVSSFATLLLSPFFIIIGVLVKLDSKGPALYFQERVGRSGVLFKLFKFRTMHVDADKLAAITIGKRDPRITRVGYYLRKYKVDELLQLVNVLKGDMSLVGPRPEVKKFVDLYNERQRQVISVRPGITDYASIKFRNENELLEGKEDPIGYYVKEIMPAKLELNLEYIENRSFLLDCKILLLTSYAVIFK